MTRSHKRGGRRGNGAPAAVAAMSIVMLAGLGAGLVGMVAASHPAGGPATVAPLTTHTASQGRRPAPEVLTRSAPVRLTIPSIGVDGGLQHLGLTADRRTMQLPPQPASAGWYVKGPTPGEAGPTIIVGYIASQHGPGVFYRLAALRAGDRITIRRSDSRLVVYRVDRIASYSARNFPAGKVYTRTAQPTLRVITCGGALEPGKPAGNVVVYAHQVAVTG